MRISCYNTAISWCMYIFELQDFLDFEELKLLSSHRRDAQFTCDVTSRRFRVTVVAMGKISIKYSACVSVAGMRGIERRAWLSVDREWKLLVRRVRKIPKSFIMPVCPPVSTFVLNSSATTGWIFMKFGSWVFFENLTWKFKLHSNTKRTTFTPPQDQYTFLIISRSVFIRTRNISDKGYREFRNTHFMLQNVFRKSQLLLNDVEK